MHVQHDKKEGLKCLKFTAIVGVLLLVGDDFVLTGFKEDEWKEKLLKN